MRDILIHVHMCLCYTTCRGLLIFMAALDLEPEANVGSDTITKQHKNQQQIKLFKKSPAALSFTRTTPSSRRVNIVCNVTFHTSALRMRIDCFCSVVSVTT